MSYVFAVTSSESLAMLLVAACVGGALWWSQRRRHRARAGARSAAAPAVAASADGPRPDELRRWEIEMHELARSLTGELNTRIAILQQLLHSAEAQAARLERLLAREETAERLATERVAPPVESGASPRQVGPSPRPRREELLALASRGATVDEIVAATGAPSGEVELVMSLLRAGAEP